jgi:hypothetical protein
MCQQCKIDDTATNPHSRINRKSNDDFNYINNFIIVHAKTGNLFDIITSSDTSPYCTMSYNVVMKNHHPDIYKKFITYLLLK